MVTVIGACEKQGTPTCCARKPQYLLSGFYSVDVELGSQPLIQVDPDRAKENMKFTIDYDGFDDLLAPIYQRPLTSRVEKPINYIPSKSEENCLLLTKREAVGSALGSEIRSEFKASTTVIMKPKQDCFAKSASQRGNSAARMAMTRRVHSLLSINPYQGSWNIKIYNNARGEECVFNVELSDKKGMQIQATISKAAARKFYDRFQKGPLKLANKRFKTVQNDYAMIVNENSEVDEARNDNFVLVDEIGAFGNQKELKDAIAVAQTVSSTMSIRSWNDNETILKKGITLADEKEKNVVVFIWSELATGIGQDKYTAGDFQGVPLSSISRSNVMINPGSPDATKTKYWYDSEACTSAFIKPEQTMWYRGLQDSGL